jgi:hypothetical protein
MEAQHWAEEAWRVSREQNMAHYCMYADCVRGWILARRVDRSGIELLEQGVAQVREVGDRMNLYRFCGCWWMPSERMGCMHES